MYRSRIQAVARTCACLVLTSLGSVSAIQAALVGTGGYNNDFAAQPLAVDWSTFSMGGVGTDITGPGAMDAAVQALSAGSIGSQVAADPADPPPLLATATWSAAGLYLQTRATGNAATALMCTLVNGLGGNAAAVTISYDFAKIAPAAEEVEGHHAYYSLTGAPGSWVLINEFTTANPGRLSVTINLAWPNGGNLYVLWTDDNGSPSPDTALQIDNFSVTATPAVQTPAAITAHPQSQSVGELQPVAFAVGVSGNPTPTVQWYTNGVAVAGATSTSFSIASAPLAFNGLALRAVAQNFASNVAYSVTSSVATLTVNADTVRPVLLGAAASGLNQVVASFSEKVTPQTATSVGNYGVTWQGGSQIVSNALLDASQTNVVLTVTTMTPGTVYTLTVNGVRDQSAAANLVLANSQAQFTAVTYSAADIGGPAGAGSSVAVGNGFAVTGGGTNIFGNSDQFAFNSRTVAGDFDLEMRVDGFNGSEAWAKAGMMAREALTANSKFAAVFATPSLNGTFFSFRLNTGTNVLNQGSFPTAHPSTWLRLKRAGAVFTGFAGVDGQTWVQLGTTTLSNPAPVFNIGMAVTATAPSNALSATATAQFRDMGDASAGVVGTVTLPFEPAGPSARTTGLVISEIMYHPKYSNTLEFVEIFNAGLIPENLGGYRIAGAVDYIFPPNTTLPVGSYLVVARFPAALQAASGISGVHGPWVGANTNAMPDDTGTVRLRNRTSAILLEVVYDTQAPWPTAADGTGHSLVLARPSYGEADPRAWSASSRLGGSPGRGEPYSPDPLGAVVINEFLAHTDLPLEDYIELYNHSTQPVDISGAYLSDDRDANKFRIPNGTILPARGFVTFIANTNTGNTGFSLSSAGERIYFINPSQTRVLDMVIFEAQANGVASGRYPDGAPGIHALNSRTPGTANATALIHDVVINELMFNPISGSDDDEYVELYNRGAAPVNLTDWRITAGINFRFPANTTIPANGYLVIAKDKPNLLAKYPQLNDGNTLGNYGGVLANGGERVAISRPDYFFATNNGVVTTQANYIVVDETTFVDSGRAARWADGGGSSLELTDPFSNHRLAANWADSDETQKSAWTNLAVTAVADHVYPVNAAGATMDEVQVMILGAGEVLMDDVVVHAGASGVSIVSNPNLNSGLTGWVIQGNHVRSRAEPVGPNNPSPCLRIVATAGGDQGVNRVECQLNGALTANAVATIGAKFRWLRGFPIVLMRVHGGGIEAVGTLPVPSNLGSPGLVNSRRVSNAGPAIFDVSHAPVMPAASEDTVLTARVNDPDGIAVVRLLYRLDPSATVNTLNLRDDGVGGDAVAADGLYSVTIPGLPAGTTVAFRIEATDARVGGSAVSLFPATSAGEALIRFGDPAVFGTVGVYRIWMTATNISIWTNRERLSNEALDGTFVYGNFRAIYNSGARYRGSAFTRNPSSPAGVGVAANYVWTLPDDEPFLGSDELNLDCLEPGGSSNVRDVTALREVTAFELFNQMDLAFSYQRYVHIVINGVTSTSRNIPVYTDSQQPNGEYTAMWFPEEAAEGNLYKIDDWFEFSDTLTGSAGTGMQGNKSASLENFTTTGGVKKQARYRWSWEKKFNRGLNDDYSSLYSGVDALNAPDSVYVRQVEQNFDIRQWLACLAMRHVVGDWDGYGYQRGKNQFCYRPNDGKLFMLMWDLDFALGCNSGHAPAQDLFTVSLGGATGSDHMPECARLYNHPHFRRIYLQALREVADGPMQDAKFLPILDARYRGLVASGVSGLTSPHVGSGAQGISIPAWIQQRRAYIATQTANATNAPFRVTSPLTVTTGTDVLVITGTAPLGFHDILVNGFTWPVTWTSITGFTARVVLTNGANAIVIAGRNASGEVISTGQTINATYTGQAPSPVGLIVFNEIMPYPSVEDAEFVEIYNTTAFSYDIGGWRLNGLDYTFPYGTILTNGQYLVLAKSIPAVIRASGTNTQNLFAQYAGNLDRDGETLTLLKPGASVELDVVIDKIRYEARLPWASAPIGTSLQLADNAEDNSRSSAWSIVPGGGPQPAPSPWLQVTRPSGNLAAGTNLFFWLTTAGSCYIDDISLTQTNPGSPNIVRNGDFENGSTAPWILGTNYASSEVVTGISHSGNRSLLVRGTAPAGGTTLGATIQQFIAIDNPNYVPNTNYTLTYWIAIHTNPVTVSMRTLPGSALSVAGSTFVPVPPATPVLASPGSNNISVLTDLPAFDPVWVNELQAINVSGPVDNVGERDPWIELYNRGSSPVSLNGYYLANNYDTNLTQWAFPANATINPGQYLIVWADGQPGQTAGANFHTSFRLNSSTGSVALVRLVNSQPQITDYLTYANVGIGLSYGDFPDGQPFTRVIMQSTSPGSVNISRSVNLFINEWMASNTNTVYDPADGAFSDWFEIFNGGPTAVDLGGYHLTDDLGDRTQFTIPSTGRYVVPPQGFLLVWADEDSGTQNTPDSAHLHVNFRLGVGGDTIALVAPDGTTLVDSVTFGGQTDDVSEGRFADGSGNFIFMTAPTPGAANRAVGGPNTAPQLNAIPNFTVAVGQTVSFTATATDAEVPPQTLTYSLQPGAPATATIGAANGQFSWAPSAPGVVNITVQVRDNAIPPLSDTWTFSVTVNQGIVGTIVNNGSGQVVITFSTTAGRTYRVEYTDALTLPTPNWQPLGDSDILATGPTITVNDDIGTRPQRFYRMQQLD